MRHLQTVYWRIYNDFLRADRVHDLVALIQRIIESGYFPCTVSELYRDAHTAQRTSSERLLVLRVDVDSDLRTCYRIWNAFERLNLRASFYFRLCTTEKSLMRQIDATASEVGYHYEELSTLGKRHGTRTAESLRGLLNQARDLFARNLARLRQVSKLPLTTAAAHGDWFNRFLGVANTEILTDPTFRSQVNILSEAYDPLPGITVSKHIDRSLPREWESTHPMEAVQRGVTVVYLTIHPRQWGTNIFVNAKEDFSRALEGASYFIRSRLSPLRS